MLFVPPSHDNDLLSFLQRRRPTTSQSEVDAVLARVAADVSLGRSDQDALEWASDFYATSGVSETDLLTQYLHADVAACSDREDPIFTIASTRMQRLAPNRLSAARVRLVTDALLAAVDAGTQRMDGDFAIPIDWVQFRADIVTASVFGESGVPIFQDPAFVCSPHPGPPSHRLSEVRSAVNAHLLSNHAADLCAFLPLSMLSNHDFHLQNYGLAPKYGKKKGRLTSNCSGIAARQRHFRRRHLVTRLALNTSWVALEAVRRWGPIANPSLHHIVRTVLRAAATYGWEEVVLFKDDLQGFFELCSFDPSTVHLMAFQFFLPSSPSVCEHVAFSMAGNFGWSAMPAAMEVLTRLLRACIGALIFGLMLMYVDDIIVVSTRAAWRADRAIVVSQATTLLGSDAIGEAKFDTTDRPSDPTNRTIDVIGWTLDLNSRLVSVAEKNHTRAVHWFLDVGDASSMTFHVKERLCSLAERYSAVYTELRILMSDMYSMLGGKGRVHPDTKIRTPPRARLAIFLWKLYLLDAELEREAGVPIGRPMTAFGDPVCRGLLEFDGCLDGIGWRLFDFTTSSWTTSGYMRIPSCLLLGRDSSFQNTMELIALSVGLMHTMSLGWQGSTIHIRGDSDTVIHWSQTSNFRSTFAINAAAIFLGVCRTGALHIGMSTHIPCEDNVVCDRLSRNNPVGACDAGDCGPAPPLDFSELSPFRDILLLVSPTRPPATPAEFSTLWDTIDHLLQSIPDMSV